MSTLEPLREGQEIFLKRPSQIYARVIGPREGDLGLPEDQVYYAVQLLPLEQYYRRDDLELAQLPQPKKSRLNYMSPESVEELARFNEVAPNLFAGDPFFDLSQEVKNLIASRAYELYERGGSMHGHDAEDWLQAESEIIVNVPAEITETETQLTIHARVPGFSPNDLEVRVALRSICITGKRQEVSELAAETPAGSERHANRIFLVLELPSEIDPVRVDASLGDGALEVKLLKVGLRKLVQVRAKSAAA